MSYFDDASLVMIPSGYKTSKVYSVKPTDGTGDLTFTRSNDTATRVGPDGLIEKVRTNLALYSEDQTNAAWSKTNVSVTGDTTANPVNGATTADTFTITTQTTVQGLSQSFTADGSIYTISLFLKKEATSKTISLKIRDSIGSGTTYATADLNLNTGVVFVGAGVASVVDYDANWWRLIVTTSTAPAAGTRNIVIRVSNVAVSETFTIFGAMLEKGDIATDYIETTTAAVSVGPVANVPRLDYLNSSCPRLLLEPQATALNQFSESFDNAYWSLSRTSAFGSGSLANAVTAPDGTQSAEYIQQATGQTSGGGAFRVILLSTGNYTISIFAKKAEQRYLRLGGALAAGGASLWCNFDLETGTIGTPDAGVTPKIENYGNGWFRCSITANKVDLTGQNVFFYQANTLNGSDATPLSGLYLWGANVTQTSYLQSYIPTLGASATRGADDAIKTGISSLIGQTEGVLFAEFNVGTLSSDVRIVATMSSGSSSNFVSAIIDGTDFIARIRANTGALISVTKSSLAAGTHKMAIAYSASDLTFYLDGVLVGQNTSASVAFSAALSELTVGKNIGASALQLSGGVAQALIFKTRLTNAQLAELTA